MAKGQITDSDLVNTNIVNGVEIFGVTGNYSNSEIDIGEYYLGLPAVSGDNQTGNLQTFRGALLFYDNGTKIIIMGSSEVQSNTGGFSLHGIAGYYAEILKSTGVLTIYPSWQSSIGTTTSWGNTKMVYANIGGTNRYAFTRASADSSNGFFYFNGTDVVAATGGDKTTILGGSNIGGSSISYRGKTLTAGRIISVEKDWALGSGGACLQTLQYD